MTDHQKKQFALERKNAIAREFSKLNEAQLKGVLTTEGPLLLLAGAGSGKTTVLINRIANILKYGKGSDSDFIPSYAQEEDIAYLRDYNGEFDAHARKLLAVEPAAPWNIIAITFTNKAANELKSRLEKMLGPAALDVWASTFHSACVRILRREIERLGFTKDFTIYDTTDSLSLLKMIIKDFNMDDKSFPPRSLLSAISRAKDEQLSAVAYSDAARLSGDMRKQAIAKIYCEYSRRCIEANALDFDDIIFFTVRILTEYADVREYYQNKFKYVLVDEYQDTNSLQYNLVALLSGKWKNVCVVGDDDQSIYKFRGATIENILNFESDFKNARVVRLERNYRSTKNILNAANAIISNNVGRKGKVLWTEENAGERVTVYTAVNENEEAQYIAGKILEDYSSGARLCDIAILYRMNAQSNQLEFALKRNGIGYKIIGGHKFFDRAEVKDILAYLAVINNSADNLRLMRVVNNPTRGIGEKTLDTVLRTAESEGISAYEVMLEASKRPDIVKAAPKLNRFIDIIESLKRDMSEMSLETLYDELLQRSGYLAMLEARNTPENMTRIENIKELKSNIIQYVKASSEPSLSGFLDEIALYTDIDKLDDNADTVTMMTMHSAKGLEFQTVFIAGVEEGIFPGIRTIGDNEEIEEERRLCYVAVTRARKKLYITCAHQRMLLGRTSSNLPSRFLDEIPEQCVERVSAQSNYQTKNYSFNQEWEGGYNGQNEGYTRKEFNSTDSRRYGVQHYVKSDSKAAKQPVSVIQPTQQMPKLELRKGDQVEHKAFGKGMVISVAPMGGDAMLEIAFDEVGTKRLMAKSAAKFMTKK